MDKIGFVGLGNMGTPMVRNLIKKSGNPIYCYDIDINRMTAVAQEGATALNDINAIAANCDIVFLCMPSNEILEQNMKILIEEGKQGLIMADVGSTSPDTIRRLSQYAEEKGKYVLDCPVSGGPAGAENGTLAIMCGGDESIYQQILPYLHCIGKTITYTGRSGNGSVTKLVNNIIVGGILLSIAEAFAFGSKAGLDATTLFNAIKDGGAKNAFMENNMFRRMIEHDYVPGARMTVHQKDLNNALKLAAEMSVCLPLTNLILDYMAKLQQQGRENEDHCAIATVYEQEMDTYIK